MTTLRHFFRRLLSLATLSVAVLLLPADAFSQGTLVAAYTFDGNANDVSGNSHHGTLFGPVPATDRFGNANSAYAFDGGDWIEVPHAPELNFGSASTFTINVWVKACATQIDYAGIIAKGPTNTYIPGYQLVIRGEYPEGLISQDNGDFVGVLGNRRLLDSSWHMLTLIVSAPTGIVKLYIDGVLNNTSYGTGVDPSVQNMSNMFIGKERNSTRHAKGAIDDISIFDYALSDATIAEYFKEGGWPFFAGQGSLKIDAPDGNSYCRTGNLRLIASGSLRYRWSPAVGLSNPNIANPIASPTVTTTYTVVGLREDSPCGTTLTAQVTITVGDPIPDLGNDTTVCAGSSVQLDALPRGGTPPYQYSWSPATGLSSTSIAQPTASPSTTTDYIVNVIDAVGCIGSDTIRIVVQPSALRASTTSFDFGELIDCGTQADSSFTVTNDGTSPLDLNNLIVSGPGFSIVGITPSSVIGPGESATITVRFAPTSGGRSTGRLVIHSTPCDANLSIDLFGTQSSLAVTVAPNPIDFGTDAACVATYRDTTIVITNGGSQPLTVFPGIVASPFSVIAPVLPIDIAPGTSQTLTIRSEPTADGVYDAILLLPIQSGLCRDTLRVNLRHRRAGVNIVIKGQTDFGSSFPGAIVDRVIAVTNAGQVDVRVDSVTVQPPFTILSAVPQPPIVLRPGDSIAVTIRYVASSGRDTARLQVFVGLPCMVSSDVEIHGDGDERAYCRVYIPDLSAAAGDVLDLPLLIDSSNALKPAGAYRFTATIAFDRTVLFPDAGFQMSTDDTIRRIVITGTRRDDSDVLKLIPVTAMLGRVDSTMMVIESFEWIEPLATFPTTTVDGLFTLVRNCPEGGPRHYSSSGRVLLRSVVPDPVTSESIVDFELVETGHTRLSVVDALGHVIVTLFDAPMNAGSHTLPLNVSSLSTGVYTLVLETQTLVRSKRFTVIR